jgi:hypothetical protein
MRHPRWLAAAAAAIVVATVAGQAKAYCRTTTCNVKTETCRIVDSCARSGAPASWAALPIPYRFHAQGPERLDRDEARGAIRLAFARWTEAICPDGRRTSLRFKEGPEIPANEPRGKEPFGIYFRDDGWPHDDVNETLALTTQYFNDRSGEIRYSDIEVNTRQHQFVTRDDEQGKDLEAVITHEVGHYIGLAHSPDPASIMTPQYCQSSDRCRSTKELSRDLSDDDVEAVCALYPPGGTGESAGLEENARGCALARAPADGRNASHMVVTLCGAAGALAGVRRARRVR